ncbi:MAG TPA: hypothetical protein VF052_09305 [Solirubrobacterales bacterium]
MKTASRTLVKSQPELWELIDQPNRMQGLMCALLGRAAEVAVNQREPESLLCWKAAGEGEDAWISVELAEKGWGTYVEVSAENSTEPVRLGGWLDAVLDELATPQKRPFEGMSEAPPAQEPPAEAQAPEAPDAEPAPVEKARVEPEPVEPAPVEPAPVDPAPVEAAPAPAPRRKKRRRFFGF